MQLTPSRDRTLSRVAIGRVLAALLLLGALVRPAQAINITLDYTYDTSNFFGAGNPSGATAGAQAKAALEAAAGFYSTILTDTFSAIEVPANFQSSFGGVATFSWTPSFSDPATGATGQAPLQSVAADEYRIFAGARSLGAGTLGIGGFAAGGYSYNISGVFGPGEYNTQVQKANAFAAAVTTRGESSGFAAWGGSITFDNDGSTNWHYNHTLQPTAGTSDFYSVAVHELGHALGLGVSDEWKAYATSPNFTGPAATSNYGGNPPLSPLVGGTRGHWASGTMSTIFGTNTSQEAAMDPEVTTGTRKRLTALDAAALTDIGWTVVPPSPTTFNPADFNEDTLVNGADLTTWKGAFGLNANGDADGDSDSDGADYLIWQRNFGATSSSGTLAMIPEPTTLTLMAGSAGLLIYARRRRLGR